MVSICKFHKASSLAIMGPSRCRQEHLPAPARRRRCADNRAVLLEDVGSGHARRRPPYDHAPAPIGFIFQSFNLLPTLSAEENVALPLLLDGVSTAEAGRRAVALPLARQYAAPPHARAEQALWRRAAAHGDCPRPGDRAGFAAGR